MLGAYEKGARSSAHDVDDVADDDDAATIEKECLIV